ncbi:hypothetical protein [Moritella sp.]|nr:hypothetical protein [Moritella sp.]
MTQSIHTIDGISKQNTLHANRVNHYGVEVNKSAEDIEKLSATFK